MTHTSQKRSEKEPSPSASHFVAIVVLNWNGFHDTVECVRSLLQISYDRFEIIIVDNASTDGSPDKLEHLFPKIVVLRRQTNGGYAAGNNDGIRFALRLGADFILLINNDVVVDKNFLEPLVDILDKKEDVGVVTCKAFFAGQGTLTYCTAGRFSNFRCSGAPLPKRLEDTESEVTYISGCILLIRKEVFHKVGFLEEKFFMYFEDMEFSNRVRRVFKLYYTPSGVVFHKSGGGTSWQNFNELYLYYNMRNRFLAFQEEGWLRRGYVLAFSIVLATAKSISILYFILLGKSINSSLRRIRSVWEGVIDGCAGVVGKAIKV
ncbi:MAG TPA: glycosyltransferase family 2 protein [Bacteroidota bacterium]|nr:glycosyltransferase family 2 protein [Bacteroidota bacterium]